MDAFVDMDIAELELLMEQQGITPEATPYGDEAMFTPELYLSHGDDDAYTNSFDAFEEAWLDSILAPETVTSGDKSTALLTEDDDGWYSGPLNDADMDVFSGGFGLLILDFHSNALGTAIIDDFSEFFDNPQNGLWFAIFASVIAWEYDIIIADFYAIVEGSDPDDLSPVLDEDDICSILQAEFVFAGGLGGVGFGGIGAGVGALVGAIYWELVDQEFDCD